MDLVFALKGVAKALVLPPGGPLLIALAGLLLWRRAPRLARALAMFGVVSLLLLSLPVVAWVLTRAFDREPFDTSEAKGAQAIVILGGGTRNMAPEYGGDTLGRLTLERVRYGARVAKATGLPVLVTGGKLGSATHTEADLMAEALHDEFAVNVRWREDASRNTHENAQFSARLLRAQGVSRIVLVAHAIDMPRGVAEFAAAGVVAIPAATGLPSRGGIVPMDFLPRASALLLSHDALYEMLANLVRAVAPPAPSGATGDSPRAPAPARVKQFAVATDPQAAAP
ncbi:MAG TPA: YdcF family protein [Casimicrobiaceae bacterium]|nr:YdcF family protein [Casimicrobiaceae bacterium]